MDEETRKDIVKDSHQVKDSNSFARVNVNYNGQKPEVKFSFPGEKEPGNAGYYSFITAILILVLIQTFYFVSVLVHDTYFGPGGVSNAEFNACVDYYNENVERVITNTCTNLNNTNKLVYSRYYLAGEDIYYNLKMLVIYQIPAFLIIWAFIFTVFGKKINENEPRMQIKLGKKFDRHYSTIFTQVPKEKYLEIPLFKNVWLDYNATGEFSKYLTEVDIREHPFKVISHLGRKANEKPNTYLWRARFYFSKIPKDGQLEVEFK